MTASFLKAEILRSYFGPSTNKSAARSNDSKSFLNNKSRKVRFCVKKHQLSPQKSASCEAGTAINRTDAENTSLPPSPEHFPLLAFKLRIKKIRQWHKSPSVRSFKSSYFHALCADGVALRSLAGCLNSPLCVYTSGFPCLQPIPHLEAILDTDQ